MPTPAFLQTMDSPVCSGRFFVAGASPWRLSPEEVFAAPAACSCRANQRRARVFSTHCESVAPTAGTNTKRLEHFGEIAQRFFQRSRPGLTTRAGRRERRSIASIPSCSWAAALPWVTLDDQACPFAAHREGSEPSGRGPECRRFAEGVRAQGDAALAEVPGLLERLDIPQICALWPRAQVRVER